MNTPIDFAFNVEINTVDGTAGTYLCIIHTTLVQVKFSRLFLFITHICSVSCLVSKSAMHAVFSPI